MNYRALGVLVCVGVWAAAGMGCQEQVFSPNEARSQFDKFDAVRDRRAPQYYFDEFGTRRPNLRARLQTAD